MGRPKGSKNYSTVAPVPAPTVKVTAAEKEKLTEIFTCSKKDVISIRDFMEMTGLSYDLCAKLVREIKSVSDIIGIVGHVHRTDYFMYLSRRYEAQE